MDERIGFYQEGRRVLPAKTIGGKKVRKPVETTIGITDDGLYFAVCDDHPIQGFKTIVSQLKAEVEALNAPVPEVLPMDAAPEVVEAAPEVSTGLPVFDAFRSGDTPVTSPNKRMK